MHKPSPASQLLCVILLICCSLAFKVAAQRGRYHGIRGLDCVHTEFTRRQQNVTDLHDCMKLCDGQLDCQAVSLKDGHCKLFVFNRCSKNVRDCSCSQRSQIYVRHRPGLSPGALCPDGFSFSRCGTKYMWVQDGSTAWFHYQSLCLNMPGLVMLADIVDRAEMEHLFAVKRFHFAGCDMANWDSVAIDGRQFGSPKVEPAGGWFWETCGTPMSPELWAPGEPNDGAEDFGYLVTLFNGLNDGKVNILPPSYPGPLSGICECVSPFD